MASVYFVVPVYGRETLARVCLRQLRRTCDQAAVEATAVVIGEGDILDYAYDLGFATVRRNNKQLGRRFNDGYQLACDPRFNDRPADYVIPCGSDDWIDPRILETLPGPNTMGIFKHLSLVNEDRTELAHLTITYQGGAGIRIVPRALVEAAEYRPCQEDIGRGCDTSALTGFTRANGGRPPAMVALDRHPLQIVDFKSRSPQLNAYRARAGFGRKVQPMMWDQLADVYPEAVADMLEVGA